MEWAPIGFGYKSSKPLLWTTCTHLTHTHIPKTFSTLQLQLPPHLWLLPQPPQSLGRMFGYNSQDHSSAMAGPGSFTCLASVPSTRKSKKNQRRFSDEQIKSLESIFESETKLEPRKKLELASELGLQPRQVAIWFQNKRARWKSKQLERDYCTLRTNYNSLVSQLEMLKEEKQSLIKQLNNLNTSNLVQQSPDIGQACRNSQEFYGTTPESRESDAKPTFATERDENRMAFSSSDDDSSIKAEYFGMEEEPVHLSVENVLASAENWSDLEPGDLFDQSNSSYQWWDVWS